MEPKNSIKLTEQEKNVAAMVAKGKKDKEIAYELFISRRRVGEIIFHIKQKFHINSRVEIGILAYQLNLLEKKII
ncbi:helix-turn-helix transcriptional regulator [Priestia megaterium]|nr:helix-turn-helix transcriptional regulator [Priestia megaterium]